MIKLILIISSIFTSLSFLIDCSLVNLEKEKISKKLYDFPSYLVNDSIRYYEEKDELKPYIKQTVFEENVTSYFNSLLIDKVKYIEYKYFYYNDQNIVLDTSEYKTNAEITIDINVSTFYSFKFYKVIMVS